MRLPQSTIYIANEYVCSRTSAYLTFMMLKIFNVSWGNVFTKNVVSTCSTYAMYLTVNRLVRYTHFYSWCMYTKAALRFFFSLKRFYSALRPYPRQYFHLCSLIFFFYSRTKLNDIYSIDIYIGVARAWEDERRFCCYAKTSGNPSKAFHRAVIMMVFHRTRVQSPDKG